jgi:hypothetical protein
MFRAVQYETDEEVRQHFRNTVNEKLRQSKIRPELFEKVFNLKTPKGEAIEEADEEDNAAEGDTPTTKGETERKLKGEESKEEDNVDDEKTKKAESDEDSGELSSFSNEDKEDEDEN